MDNQELLQAISALLEKELGQINSRLDKLEAGQEQIREEMNRRFDEVDKRFDELTLAVGDIVNDVCDVMAAREEPIYQALEENRQAINLLARPLVMPAIQKTK